MSFEPPQNGSAKMSFCWCSFHVLTTDIILVISICANFQDFLYLGRSIKRVLCVLVRKNSEIVEKEIAAYIYSGLHPHRVMYQIFFEC